MATPPGTPPGSLGLDALYDPSQPFRGVVICCTSIPAEMRTDIDAKTRAMGGIHKYDLTPDVTHLIVGEYDTPKYRHVAKERPDIRPMAAGWIGAVLQLWKEDDELDFAALENAWQLRALETNGGDPNAGPEDSQAADRARLICSVSGFDDPIERQAIVEKIEAHGGIYMGDLTRKATHLIVRRPEGKKYSAAKKWDIHVVLPQWLDDSCQRGMILSEACYDPCLPAEEVGVGAWMRREAKQVSLGKRLRESAAAAQEQGKRKLRKTASMKLSSQRDNLWGDILSSKPGPAAAPVAQASPFAEIPTQPAVSVSFAQYSNSEPAKATMSSFGGGSHVDSIFSSCGFYIDGFSAHKTEILVNTVSCLGGLVCQSLEEVVSASGAQLSHRFVIVPQNSKPESHPRTPQTVDIVTEFYIEKCLHRKHFVQPNDHVIGRPFPVFPVDGFDKLIVCTAGFTGVDLNQVDKTVRQLGAKYEERFSAQVSVLVCSSLSAVRKEKLSLALSWKVPVVNADWLWECIATGYKVPIRAYLFKELKQRLPSHVLELCEPKETLDDDRLKLRTENSAFEKPVSKKSGIRDIDNSAFDDSSKMNATARPREMNRTKDESFVTNFATAQTHIERSFSEIPDSGPLAEVHPHALNRSSSTDKAETVQPDKNEKAQPNKTEMAQSGKVARKPISRVVSEIADSEATDDGDVGDSTLLLAADEAESQASLPAEPEPSPPPAAIRRRSTEEAAARQAAERLAISSKLTTLLDGPVGAATEDILTRTRSAPAAAMHRPPRRKREILGRAISNASAGSANSLDESFGPALVSHKASSAAGSFSAVLSSRDLGEPDADAAEADPASQAPPPTQLEYADEKAAQAQEMVMTKLLGAAGRKTRNSRGAAGMSGGMTIGDVAAMIAEAEGVGQGGRRTRRRG